MSNGKAHYKWPFSIAILVYQRVTLSERPKKNLQPAPNGDAYANMFLFNITTKQDGDITTINRNWEMQSHTIPNKSTD